MVAWWLLRLTAQFGDAPSVWRARVRTAAPWLGAALAVAGLLHGVSWITQCQNDCAPADRPLDALAITSYDAYLFLDAFVRALMIAAAIAGLVHASKSERQRLLLVAISCTLFAAGTIVNFSARLLPLDAVFPSDWRHIIDAVSTLAFPILLWIAILKRRLFDVEYVLSRALVYSAVIATLGLSFVLTEQLLHFFLGKWSYETVIIALLGEENAKHFDLEMIADVLVGIALTFAFKPLEELATDRAAHALAPEREKRIKLLTEFAEHLPLISDGAVLERRLVQTLERGTDAIFADVYTRDAHGAYIPTPTSAAAAPPIGDEVASRLARGKPIVGAHARSMLMSAELALPMLVAGKLFGVIVCGPKRSEVSYAPDEIKQLAAIAREAGAGLFALRFAT